MAVSFVRMSGILYIVQGGKKINFVALTLISIHAYGKLSVPIL